MNIRKVRFSEYCCYRTLCKPSETPKLRGLSEHQSDHNARKKGKINNSRLPYPLNQSITIHRTQVRHLGLDRGHEGGGATRERHAVPVLQRDYRLSIRILYLSIIDWFTVVMGYCSQ